MIDVVTLTNLHKHYGSIGAVNGVSLSVRRGEVLGLLGHNGAGKTTLMKLILGLSAPSSGEVRVFGQSPRGKNGRASRLGVGYLPENVAFYGGLTGREVLGFFASLKGVSASGRDELLERVGLASAANRRVKGYSKGMRQRLGLAQALLGRPRLLLFDEPTAGLDPLAIRDFYVLLDELRSGGTTVILSSHVLAGVERHIDRAAILGGGRLLVIGNHEELGRRACLPFTIRVRGRCNAGDWKTLLEHTGAQVRRVSGTELELTSPPESKLMIMRAILDQDGVEDIELEPPTLEALYAHFEIGSSREEPSCATS